MRLWSNNTKKRVEFTDEVADRTLLASVEAELAKHPSKSFSHLCKQALWQLLHVPDSVRPTSSMGAVDEQIARLQGQLANLEQRIAAKEANRLDEIERQVQQLTVQVSQLAIAVGQGGSFSGSPPQPEPEPEPPPQPVDPMLSRLSSLVDDF
ncbi:plasmid segregation centromere-binding protein ParR [Oxynema aestuarii]|jgi:hypothetical protein|uniref:Plasmid segregation centromere-binding protein ParR n=1 Tax=Oxynema aestuarii AP17 TaxID=2064643 RepID=A0A6H1TT02_9CYAN|nr:plasmid segregation centromere-binding protein ParR [Oxynema aestuarii]QIZ69671.1 plasmid segregation centromere-binding protein ParR [Oxynema aestuarii AP17]RMH77800.1 MAG: plasmid segregation centromere-binding protein ParR [Cyanobacteria bacterium J007]